MFELIDKLCEEAVRYGFNVSLALPLPVAIFRMESCYYVSVKFSTHFGTPQKLSRDPNTRPVLCRVLGFPLSAERQPSSYLFPLYQAAQAITNAISAPSSASVSSYPLLPPTPRPQDHSNRFPFPPFKSNHQILLPTPELKLCLPQRLARHSSRWLWGSMGLRRRGRMFG